MPPDPSPPLTLTVDWPEITLENLSRLSSLWADLVQAASADLAGKRRAIKWVIRRVTFDSPLVLEAVPSRRTQRIDPEVVQRISRTVLEGMQHLEQRPDKPEAFSLGTLSLAKKLALQADAERQRRIVVSNGSEGPVEVTPRTAANISEILGPVTESYGSVEGRLEGVHTHGKRRFYVYDSLSGRQVRCFFDNRIVPLSDILAAYEKRVSVGGLIRSKTATGEPLSIEASELIVFDSDDDLPSTDEIRRMWSATE